MAIERYGKGGGELSPRVGLKAAAEKAIKHAGKKAAKKHAAKKHAAKKHAAKGAGGAGLMAKKGSKGDLGKAFHHLQRAAAVVSLLGEGEGADLRKLLDHGVRVYRVATGRSKPGAAEAALGLLRAAEHLSQAGLYVARREFAVQAQAPEEEGGKDVDGVRRRVDALPAARGENSRWLRALATELVRRAEAEEDGHLRWEFAVAADGLCLALEEGM